LPVTAGALIACSIASTSAFLAPSGMARGCEKAEPDAEELLRVAHFPAASVCPQNSATRFDVAMPRNVPALTWCAQGRPNASTTPSICPAAQGRRPPGGRAGVWDADEIRTRKTVDQR